MKALAQARPMPLLPPVIRTFLPLRPRSILVSFRGDFSGLDDLAEALHFVGDEAAGFLRRGGEGVEALLREFLVQLLRLQRLVQRIVQARDDLARRAGG